MAAVFVSPLARSSRINFRTKARRGILRAPHEAAILRGALPLHFRTKTIMKSLGLLACLFAFCLPASAGMSRVVAVIDSRTIVVEADGARSTVALKGVAVAAEEETAAADFLRRLVSGSWVLVEQGDVYRSPDALYVNAEMIRRAWRTAANMRYLCLLYTSDAADE